MLYPLKFRPIFQERVWGGRNLERLYQEMTAFGLQLAEEAGLIESSITTSGSIRAT